VSSRFIGPFEITKRVRKLAYKVAHHWTLLAYTMSSCFDAKEIYSQSRPSGGVLAIGDSKRTNLQGDAYSDSGS